MTNLKVLKQNPSLVLFGGFFLCVSLYVSCVDAQLPFWSRWARRWTSNRRSQTIQNQHPSSSSIEPGSDLYFKILQMNRNREIDMAMGANPYGNGNKKPRTPSKTSGLSMLPQWLREKPVKAPRFDTVNLRDQKIYGSSFDEFNTDFHAYNLHPWRQQQKEKRQHPDCGYDFDFTRFDERCCFDEDAFLRAMIKSEEEKGYIVNSGSYYWDRSSEQCLLSEPRPLMNIVNPDITDGFKCREQRDCEWYGESGNCFCRPVFVGTQLFRGYTYKLYKARATQKKLIKQSQSQRQKFGTSPFNYNHINYN